MNRTIALLSFALLLLQQGIVTAQTYEAGISGGAATYIGDFNPYDAPPDLIREPGMAFGGFLRYNHTQHLSLRLALTHGRISGITDNSPYELPDHIASFETSLTELALMAEINFLPYVAGDSESLYTPYIFGGSGAFLFKYPDPGTHELKLRRLSFILGIGLKFHISNAFTGGVDWGMRSTSTDQLDGVYSVGGNPKENDWYSFAAVSITFRFRDRGSAVCPY